ncbi:hypothetical protein [Corynebacterium matruchotii]|uniref:hypothetical protein n=1 Tax=Corynebacterium matruchotii TaxID=43768 RepID=UPI0028E1D717|nr:hypothetical protein [Corynebacterium matruchotii]
MQKNKISATATRRFMAGALSVALLGGGLAVVPAVATAQDAQCVVNEPRKGNGVGELSFDKQTYKPGDVVTMTGTGFAARPSDGFLGMKLNSNKSEWPADQSAGDNLEYNEGNATTLEIPAATVGNGNFTVRVVLPAFDAKFQAGKQVITLLGGNDGGPVASRSAVIWVNETGDDSDACGATPSVKPQPDPQPQPEPSQPEKTSEAPAPKPNKTSEPEKTSEPAKTSEKPKPSQEPQNNLNKGVENLLNYFKDGTNVRKVVIAVASVLGIAGLATAVLGSLVKLNLIPRDWFPPQFRF